MARRRTLAERFWRFRGSRAFEDAANKGLVGAILATGAMLSYVQYATTNGYFGEEHGLRSTQPAWGVPPQTPFWELTL